MNALINSKIQGRRVYENVPEDIKLIIIGGTRNQEDQDRVESLKEIVNGLDLAKNIVFEVNVSKNLSLDKF